MTEIRELTTEVAEQEFGERRNNQKLIDRLDDIVGGLRPWTEDQAPCNMLVSISPQLAVPTVALTTLMQCVSFRGGRVPTIFTYKASDFTSTNPKSAATLTPLIGFERTNREGERVIEARRIKLGDWRGEAIGDIPTNYEGLNLGDLYNRFLGNLTPCRYRQLDMSDFYLGLTRLVDKGSIKARANDYYLGLMALEQVYGPGISMGSNPDFTRRVVGPALVKAAEMLGVVPTVLARTDYPDFSLLNGRDPGLVIATKYKDMAELEADLNLRRVQDER